jgi:hypothetical protein
MKKGFSEQEVLELLDHLKSAGNEYPSDMIRSRREVFIKQAAAITMLTGPSGGMGAVQPGVFLQVWNLSLWAGFGDRTGARAGGGSRRHGIYLPRTIADFVNSTLFPKTERTAVPPRIPPLKPAVIPAMGEEDATETSEAVPTLTSSPTAIVTVTAIQHARSFPCAR